MFVPAIKIATEGFKATPALAFGVRQNADNVSNDPGLRLGKQSCTFPLVNVGGVSVKAKGHVCREGARGEKRENERKIDRQTDKQTETERKDKETDRQTDKERE